MADTANLILPLMSAAQSQKHLTHNDAIKKLDTIVQLSVKSSILTAPPGSPVEGDRYIIGSSPTGAWAGKDLNVTSYLDGVWVFFPPRLGWIAFDENANALEIWNGTAWVDFAGSMNLASTAAPVTFTDSLFTMQDEADNTKKAQFQLSGITTATTRTYTLPNVTGALATLGNLSQTFTGTTAVSGTFTASGTTASLGTNAAASTINVGTGANASGVSKSVNVGTGGASGSTTTLVFGSATAGALGTATFNSPTITFSAINTAINISGTTTLAGPSTTATLLYLGLGGASPDATNCLSINSPAALFNNAGTSISLTLNKNAAANDASFTFQTAFSSRALFGLLGDDHFTIKTTPNGSTYKTGLVVSKDTAAVSLVEHPKFSCYCNFGQNYATATWTDMAANVARHNDQGDLAIASNVATFTAPHDGYYMFGAGCTFETGNGTPTAIKLGISVNNATPNDDTCHTVGDATITTLETSLATTAMLKLTAGDTVKAKVNFTGAGRIAANLNYFWGCQVA